MLNITKEFKEKVVQALITVRENYDGSDKTFAKQYGIAGPVYSRLKSGELDGLLKDTHWLSLGRELDISQGSRKWKMAKTEVFVEIQEDIIFCQNNAKAMIRVDDCGIGKTFSGKYLSKTLRNCFYVDCSQGKGVIQFIKLVGAAIGVDTGQRLALIKADIKYYLKNLPNPVVILDEAGDLKQGEFLIIKELWNATENACGWYMMGAEGLETIMNKGMRSHNPGFREVFSRFSEKYSSTAPKGKEAKQQFYRKLITDVLVVNMEDQTELESILLKSLTETQPGQIGGLRRAESLLILNS